MGENAIDMIKKEIKKRLLGPRTALVPTPVVLLSCKGKKGRPNLITLAWAGVCCSEPPVIGVAIRPKNRWSHHLVKETMEFVANIPTERIVRQVDFCGTVSGKEHDKFKEAGLTPIPASKVEAPLVKECPVNMECKVIQVIPLGTHDLFLGQVLEVHVDEKLFSEDGQPDFARIKPFVYTLHDYYSLGKKLGKYAFTKKKG